MRQHGWTFPFNIRANLIAMASVVFACVASVIHVQADGGTAQFTRLAGPFVITVFTTPSPLRAGPVDIGLMIQSQENHEPLLDCLAQIQLSKDGAMNIYSEATREAAQNKLFYAAQVKLPESGLWEVEATIRRGDDSVNVTGAITVAPSNPLLLVHWRSLALPPLFISLFALNQWLKRRRTLADQQRERHFNESAIG